MQILDYFAIPLKETNACKLKKCADLFSKIAQFKPTQCSDHCLKLRAALQRNDRLLVVNSISRHAKIYCEAQFLQNTFFFSVVKKCIQI